MIGRGGAVLFSEPAVHVPHEQQNDQRNADVHERKQRENWSLMLLGYMTLRISVPPGLATSPAIQTR